MALTISNLTRPVAVTNTSITRAITPVLVENDTTDEVWLHFDISETPTSFTVASCSTTNEAVSVSTTNTFEKVRVGNPVTGTGIPDDTVVDAIALDKKTITLSNPATATGTVTLTFAPEAVSSTVLALKVILQSAGSAINMNVTGYSYDGSLLDTPATDMNSSAKSNMMTLGKADIDKILTNLQVFRV